MDYDDVKRAVFSRIPPTIKNKIECYMLYERGFFGNKIDTANSYEEIIEKEWNGFVSMRSKNKRIERNKVSYMIPIERIPDEIKKWEEFGIFKNEISFNKNPPDDKLIFQGEIMNFEKGIHILYSNIKKPMNIALKEKEETVFGIKALYLLKENLFPSSFDDLMELLRLFPNDVIEFSCYDIEVGTLKNRNTIIWEVRGY